MGGRWNNGENAQEQSECGGLRTSREERGDGRGGALVDVGSPDLEGGGSDFEAEADENHGEAEFKERTAGINGAHAAKIGRAGGAVDERDAIKEEGSGEGTQKEILHRGFAGLERIAAITSQNVTGDGA